MIEISEHKIMGLKKILDKYSEIFAEDGVEDLILKAFKFEKSLTSIEIYSKKTKMVKDFIKEIKEFLFTDTISSNHKIEEILISRFKTIVHVATYFRNNHNVEDEYADLAGILFGYSPKEVAKYCSEERLKKLKLIK